MKSKLYYIFNLIHTGKSFNGFIFVVKVYCNILATHRNNFEYFYLSVHMYVQLSDPSSFFLFLMKDYKQIDLDERKS